MNEFLLNGFLNGQDPRIPNFIILEDHLSQSGLPLLHQLQTDHSLTINLKYECFKRPNQLNLIHEDLQPPQVYQLIQTQIHSQSKPITILIDSVSECFRRWKLGPSLKLYQEILNLITSHSDQSRLIVLDSPHLYPPHSSSHIKPSSALHSISISQLHLKIYPSLLLHQLIHQFGLNLPQPHSIGTHYDHRTFALLQELLQSSNPFNHHSNQSLLPQALLISTQSQPYLTGSCLILWTARNAPKLHSIPSVSLSPINKTTHPHQPKPHVILRGLEALRLDINSPDTLRLLPVPLSTIVTKPSRLSSQPVTLGKPTDGLQALQEQMTFNLSLTDQQRSDREAVQLPYLPQRAQDGTVIEAPGEIYDGSFQKTKKEPSQGFIVYEPDSADDMDDEEPDDEL